MRITVLGGQGAWPTARQACSGYLVEHEGYRLLLDPGYASFPRLLAHCPAEEVDAVLVTHGHPDHCADLNPLLRARALADAPPLALTVHAPPDALDAVLALDGPGILADAYRLAEFVPGRGFEAGPFRVETWSLPHFVPNAGMRITAGGRVLAYTGDTGPTPDIVTMAEGADVLLAEATFPERVEPPQDAPFLTTARQAGGYAAQAGVRRLLLTHLWPGTSPEEAVAAARAAYGGPVEAVVPDMVVETG